MYLYYDIIVIITGFLSFWTPPMFTESLSTNEIPAVSNTLSQFPSNLVSCVWSKKIKHVHFLFPHLLCLKAGLNYVSVKALGKIWQIFMTNNPALTPVSSNSKHSKSYIALKHNTGII